MHLGSRRRNAFLTTYHSPESMKVRSIALGGGPKTCPWPEPVRVTLFGKRVFEMGSPRIPLDPTLTVLIRERKRRHPGPWDMQPEVGVMCLIPMNPETGPRSELSRGPSPVTA